MWNDAYYCAKSIIWAQHVAPLRKLMEHIAPKLKLMDVGAQHVAPKCYYVKQEKAEVFYFPNTIPNHIAKPILFVTKFEGVA